MIFLISFPDHGFNVGWTATDCSYSSTKVVETLDLLSALLDLRMRSSYTSLNVFFLILNFLYNKNILYISLDIVIKIDIDHAFFF